MAGSANLAKTASKGKAWDEWFFIKIMVRWDKIDFLVTVIWASLGGVYMKGVCIHVGTHT